MCKAFTFSWIRLTLAEMFTLSNKQLWTSKCDFTSIKLGTLCLSCVVQGFLRVLNGQFGNVQLWKTSGRSNLHQRIKVVYFSLGFASFMAQFNNWHHLWKAFWVLVKFLDCEKLNQRKVVLQASWYTGNVETTSPYHFLFCFCYLCNFWILKFYLPKYYMSFRCKT